MSTHISGKQRMFFFISLLAVLLVPLGVYLRSLSKQEPLQPSVSTRAFQNALKDVDEIQVHSTGLNIHPSTPPALFTVRGEEAKSLIRRVQIIDPPPCSVTNRGQGALEFRCFSRKKYVAKFYFNNRNGKGQITLSDIAMPHRGGNEIWNTLVYGGLTKASYPEFETLLRKHNIPENQDVCCN